MSLHARMSVGVGSFGLEASFDAYAGEVVALLGPNGAGKSTLLRVLAGLLPVDSGRIELDGVAFDDASADVFVPPERRPVGVVFQDYLLFPHLSALENVAFGLRTRGRRDASSVALSWLGRVGLAEVAGRRPRELSGGQAQRVALARALACDPRLLLLDEPLAALDASTRIEVRRDLQRHLAEFPGIRLLVTHDPLEAAVLADRLVVLEAGRVVQTGTFADVTSRPRSRYVADLVGLNLWRGVGGAGLVRVGSHAVAVTGEPVGDVFALLPPRAVALYRERPAGSPRNAWQGRVAALDALGDRVRVLVDGPLAVVAFKATEVDVYPV
jgi:molybdate transport system ATP-binding protein